MTDLSLSDSWSRLGWVEELVARISPTVLAIDQQGKRGDLVYETGELGNFGYARYMLAKPIPVPPEVGFVIADVAVNARSCLDMAIQRVVDAYALPIEKPQFPIETNRAKVRGRATKELLRSLPAEFTQVITDLQPYYETPWGHVDIPVNQTALMIREISNANKHRNVTPALRTARSRGFAHVDGLAAEFVHESTKTPWTFGEATILEIRYPRGTATDEQLMRVRPMTNLQLMIHQSGFTYDGIGLELPISASEFLRLAPIYVRHALTVLEQAHRHVQDPSDPFHPDFDVSL